MHTLNILHVDKKPDSRQSVAEWLRFEGHRVWVAADGAGALLELSRHSIDLVITDLRMPKIDGLGLLRHIRSEYPEVSVIVASARGDVADAVVVIKEGADDFVTKPFRASEMILRVQRLGEHRLLKKQLRTIHTALGEQLGNYTLEGRIGGGGMGSVYRACHATLRRPTAIKLLESARATDRAIARFEREVQVTCRLTHPNTIAIYDYGHTPAGIFYYVMELLNGATLRDLVEYAGALPLPRVVHLLRQVCWSLREAHGVGLVHRDIKPSNIHVCERGGVFDTVKVLDFGLVEDTRHPDQAAEQITEQVLVGTPAFMAPEVIRRAASAGVASDIYALGAVAYFMITGKTVFTEANPKEMFERHMHTVPESLSQRLGYSIDVAIEALVMSCLDKEPQQRPHDMQAILEVLSAYDERLRRGNSLSTSEVEGGGESSWLDSDIDSWWQQHREGLTAYRASVGANSGVNTIPLDVEKRLACGNKIKRA